MGMMIKLLDKRFINIVLFPSQEFLGPLQYSLDLGEGFDAICICNRQFGY